MSVTIAKRIYRIHNGAQTTKSRLDRLLLSFAGLRLSTAVPGMSFSVRTTAVEFTILHFCIRDIRTSSLDLMSSVRHYEHGVLNTENGRQTNST